MARNRHGISHARANSSSSFFFLSWRQSRPDLSGISTCKSIIQRTDEWRDERVVLFASQRHQRIQMIDVAVGIGDQQLGSHLQFHLDPFPQDCLERKCQSARFKGRRRKCDIPAAAVSVVAGRDAFVSARPCAVSALSTHRRPGCNRRSVAPQQRRRLHPLLPIPIRPEDLRRRCRHSSAKEKGKKNKTSIGD